MQPSHSWPNDASEQPIQDLNDTRQPAVNASAGPLLVNRLCVGRGGMHSEGLCVDTVECTSPIQTRCFGLLTITCHGRTIDNWSRRKPRELLANLATHPGMSATHQELPAALWPTYDHLSADHLFRTALWQLRRCLAEATCAAAVEAERKASPAGEAQDLARAVYEGRVVRRLGEHYILDQALCNCDLHVVRVSLADLQATTVDGQSHQLGEARRWLMLAEYALRPVLESETFAWLPTLRRELRDLGLAALTRATDAAGRAGDPKLALEVATRRLAINPTHEEAVEIVMRLHLEHGNAMAAAACYRLFCAALARRYEPVNSDLARPTGALRALYRPLQTDQVTQYYSSTYGSDADKFKPRASRPTESGGCPKRRRIRS